MCRRVVSYLKSGDSIFEMSCMTHYFSQHIVMRVEIYVSTGKTHPALYDGDSGLLLTWPSSTPYSYPHVNQIKGNLATRNIHPLYLWAWHLSRELVLKWLQLWPGIYLLSTSLGNWQVPCTWDQWIINRQFYREGGKTQWLWFDHNNNQLLYFITYS